MTIETLGEVRLASGTVLVVDTGLLNMWSHDRAPLLPEYVAPEIAESANNGRDYRIDGADAEKAGKLFDRQWHPRYVFDIPSHGIAGTEQAFGDLIREQCLDARLVPLVPRVSHLQRARLAMEHGGGAGEFQMHGVPLVAAGGLPRTPLKVLGERENGRWKWITLALRDNAEVFESRKIGVVGVDWARLMFVDLEALGAWQHDEPIDGLADFVFWGRDAEKAAQHFGIPALGDGNYGFVDLPVQQAADRGREVDEARQEGGYKLATDFRPHSHHYRVMKQIRATPTESGTVELAGSKLCAFMTSWGDGVFAVARDLDAEGLLVGVTIDFEGEP